MGEEEGFFKGKGVKTSRSKEAIDALVKVKDKSWKEMANAFNSINEVVKSGGFQGLMGGSIESIKEQAKVSVEGLFSPITNEINQFIADISKETGLGDAINDITNSFSNLINTLAAPDTGLGKAIGFVGKAVSNTLDFAAKGWESLLTGRNAFIQDVQFFSAEQLAHIAAGRGTTTVASEFLDFDLDIDALQRALEGF